MMEYGSFSHRPSQYRGLTLSRVRLQAPVTAKNHTRRDVLLHLQVRAAGLLHVPRIVFVGDPEKYSGKKPAARGNDERDFQAVAGAFVSVSIPYMAFTSSMIALMAVLKWNRSSISVVTFLMV
jgi:hypothetical protein